MASPLIYACDREALFDVKVTSSGNLHSKYNAVILHWTSGFILILHLLLVFRVHFIHLVLIFCGLVITLFLMFNFPVIPLLSMFLSL